MLDRRRTISIFSARLLWIEELPVTRLLMNGKRIFSRWRGRGFPVVLIRAALRFPVGYYHCRGDGWLGDFARDSL